MASGVRNVYVLAVERTEPSVSGESVSERTGRSDSGTLWSAPRGWNVGAPQRFHAVIIRRERTIVSGAKYAPMPHQKRPSSKLWKPNPAAAASEKERPTRERSTRRAGR